MAAPCFSMNREDFFLARSRNLDDLSAQLRHWIDTVNPGYPAVTVTQDTLRALYLQCGIGATPGE